MPSVPNVLAEVTSYEQLREVCEDNDLPDVEIVGLHDLILKALDFSSVKMVPLTEDSDAGEEN